MKRLDIASVMAKVMPLMTKALSFAKTNLAPALVIISTSIRPVAVNTVQYLYDLIRTTSVAAITKVRSNAIPEAKDMPVTNNIGVARLASISVGTRLSVFAGAMVAVVLFSVAVLVGQRSGAAVEREVRAGLSASTDVVIDSLSIFNASLVDSASQLLGAFMSVLPQGSVIVDTQQRSAVGEVDAPTLTMNGEVINGNLQYVDDFAMATTGIAGVYVRDGDDFISISSTVLLDDGRRALGIKLDQKHPAYKAMLDGNSYTGTEVLTGVAHMVHYDPLFDDNGEAAGFLFAAVNYDERLQALKKQLRERSIGDAGDLAVLTQRASGAANFVIHRKLENKTLSAGEKNPSAKAYLDAVKRKNGSYTFNMPNQDSNVESHVVVVRHFKPWKWTIVAKAPESAIDAGSNALFWQIIYTALGGLLLIIVGLGVATKLMITKPLARAVDFAQAIARGELQAQPDHRASAELGVLNRSMIEMVEQLQQREQADREHAAQIAKLADASKQVADALDATSSAVMRVDHDGIIRYLNPAMKTMLENIKQELHQYDAGFDVAAFQDGSSEMLLDASIGTDAPARHEKVFGQKTFVLSVSPMLDSEARFCGRVVEWVDRTVDLAIEEEVSQIVAAAAGGDFSRHLSLKDKRGFHKLLATQLNNLFDRTLNGIREIRAVLAALAVADLTRTIDVEMHGIFDEMKNDANRTVNFLSELVAAIQSTAEQVNTAAAEIAAGNSDLSSRTEHQAANLEETAASMEELTSTVKHNAESAQLACKVAQEAAVHAENGGDVVGQVVRTMDEIQRSSKKVGDIVSTINSIAFQTNILALNAAVEAARAGEQGRGFAVVASEVRSLAQRTADASKEIRDLIEDSGKRITAGNKLVGRAGDTMSHIVESVKRVTDLINTISAASVEQSNGIAQVNKTVSHMDETTQQNAALVEQASAAARSLEEQAGSLAEVVGQFRLQRDESIPAEESDTFENPSKNLHSKKSRKSTIHA